MWITRATHLKTGVKTSQLKVTSTLEMNIMIEQIWVITKALRHKATNKSSRIRSKIQDRAIIIHATRSSEHKSNFSFQVRIKRVYENAHRVSEDVTLHRIECHEQSYEEPSISQSLQAKDRYHQSSSSPSQILLPTYDKREREMSKS
jgi:hypothetical protein